MKSKMVLTILFVIGSSSIAQAGFSFFSINKKNKAPHVTCNVNAVTVTANGLEVINIQKGLSLVKQDNPSFTDLSSCHRESFKDSQLAICAYENQIEISNRIAGSMTLERFKMLRDPESRRQVTFVIDRMLPLVTSHQLTFVDPALLSTLRDAANKNTIYSANVIEQAVKAVKNGTLATGSPLGFEANCF